MLEQGVQYSASDFIALKNKINAEMQRRCYTGSLVEYGGEAYAFNIDPQNGTQILADQANKVIIPVNAVNDSGVLPQNIGDPAKALNVLDAKITVYASAPLEGTNHYCKASCSGLCHTSCSTTCTGTCSVACGNDCTTSCTGTCTGTCKDGCSGSCTGGCGVGCGACADCSGGCLGSCAGSCGRSWGDT